MNAALAYKNLGGPAIIGRPFKNEIELVDVVAEGIPKATIKHLADMYGIDVRELIRLLPVTARNLHRYAEEDRLSEVVTGRLFMLADLFAHGVDALGPDYFRSWLYRPNLGLHNKKPIDILHNEVGINTVDDILGRIEHGVFS
ncbi:antitoxin Xre/MbcA/ParS toxin-binding domain-containing protein [Spirosoma koreense]